MRVASASSSCWSVHCQCDAPPLGIRTRTGRRESEIDSITTRMGLGRHQQCRGWCWNQANVIVAFTCFVPRGICWNGRVSPCVYVTRSHVHTVTTVCCTPRQDGLMMCCMSLPSVGVSEKGRNLDLSSLHELAIARHLHSYHH